MRKRKRTGGWSPEKQDEERMMGQEEKQSVEGGDHLFSLGNSWGNNSKEIKL